MALALLALSFDCADAERLAAFWAEALRRPVNPGATAASASVAVTDVASTGPRLLFHQVPEPKTVKNRLHLDLVTEETEAETERLLGLGATVLRVFEENGRHRWTTFADPEGNEFDLVTG
jgi:predicted enzyme related to lactoylglutathione lyase